MSTITVNGVLSIKVKCLLLLSVFIHNTYSEVTFYFIYNCFICKAPCIVVTKCGATYVYLFILFI